MEQQEYRDRLLVARDGNQFCALIGPDIQLGVAGFGDTIAGAFRNLAANLETEECPECFHPIGKHHVEYGCEFERGDVSMPTRTGGTVDAAGGPCGCMCLELR